MAKPKNSPFFDWVPVWLAVPVALFLQITVMMTNGSYICNGANINASLGLLNEDISMAYYATSIGVGLAFPIVGKIRDGLGSKAVLMIVLSAQVLLCLLCAQAESMPMLLALSLLLGFFKGFATIELVIMLTPIFTKRMLMMEFYCFFLPINFAAGQISVMLTAEFAYAHDWRYVYYISVAMILLSLLFVFLFFRRRNQGFVVSLRGTDFSSMIFLALFLLLASYVLNYGKVLDWLNSPQIFWSLSALPFALALFFFSQGGKSNPYLHYWVLKLRKTRIAHTYMFGAMALSGSSYMISVYIDTVLGIDAVYGNSLNMMMIPGFALAGVFCYWWSRRRPFRFRYLASFSVLGYAAYAALIYFQIRPDGTFESLILPSILRGFAMLTAFIAFGTYSMEDVPEHMKPHNAFFFLSVRSTLAAVAGICIFSNWLENRTFYYLSSLGKELDAVDPDAAAILASKGAEAMRRGLGAIEGSQDSLNSLYNTVYAQATVCATKEIFGWLLIGLLIIAAITALTHFKGRIRMRASKFAS